MPIRAVLDVNILVSAAITPIPQQQARAILDQAEERYTLILSDFILLKLESVLHYDRIQSRYPHLTEEAIQAYLAGLRKTGNIVPERTEITRDEGSQDEEDNHILAASVDGSATHLVTRNTIHFPNTFRGVMIVEPADFLRLLRQSPNPESSREQ